jgi:hypothetical protein
MRKLRFCFLRVECLCPAIPGFGVYGTGGQRKRKGKKELHKRNIQIDAIFILFFSPKIIFSIKTGS